MVVRQDINRCMSITRHALTKISAHEMGEKILVYNSNPAKPKRLNRSTYFGVMVRLAPLML